MKYYRALLFCLALIACIPTQAEIGETNVIDTIAAKPGQKNAVLLLFQARPWTDESINLFDKKVHFYAFAISSNALVEQRPDLKGKSFRIVVVYEARPPASVTKHLEALKDSLAKANIDFVWGEQDSLLDLANKP